MADFKELYDLDPYRKEFDAAASVFSPLLSELEKLRVRMPDIEYRLAESPEMIRFIILIPQKYDQT